ncbi:hypothetical protein HYW58_00810 [Candidatus Kaiserbacteria bacterium]|nr:hypothetical protein [Candidatus Kaiserbacteria bacterium]
MIKLWICSTVVFVAQLCLGTAVYVLGGSIETSLSVTMIVTTGAGVASMPINMIMDKVYNDALSARWLRVGRIITLEILAAGLAPVLIGFAFAVVAVLCARDEWEEQGMKFLPVLATALPLGIGTTIGGIVLLSRQFSAKSITTTC